MILDPSVTQQTYFEDCEVCCNPIQIRYTMEDETLVGFEATRTE